MNFEQRMEIISKWLIMDLARYERPANFSESHVKPEVELMAGDINSEISTAYNAEGLKGLLLRIGKQVRKTHKSRRWPVIAEYVNAAKDSQRDKPLQIEDINATVNEAARRVARWSELYNRHSRPPVAASGKG